MHNVKDKKRDNRKGPLQNRCRNCVHHDLDSQFCTLKQISMDWRRKKCLEFEDVFKPIRIRNVKEKEVEVLIKAIRMGMFLDFISFKNIYDKAILFITEETGKGSIKS